MQGCICIPALSARVSAFPAAGMSRARGGEDGRQAGTSSAAASTTQGPSASCLGTDQSHLVPSSLAELVSPARCSLDIRESSTVP